MTYDAIVVGGGHNGLVAAGYLGRAGKRVLLLERLDHVGGAAVSGQVFSGIDAQLSRYAYLVSLLPAPILDDLGAPVRLARRRYSSYTPDPATGGRTGLLIGPQRWGPHPFAGGFAAIGAAFDADGFTAFSRRCRLVTRPLWPTLIEPLRTRSQARRLVLDSGGTEARGAWRAMVDEPIGHAISAAVSNDVVRGMIGTDALIGTFARLDDESLRQNVCFLYHAIGGGTGDWDVPIGGMGSVTRALAEVSVQYGVEIVTGADVFGVDADGEVRYRTGDDENRANGRFILAGVAPAVLAKLVGDATPATLPGAQVKLNMVVARLPRLRDDHVTAEQAFGGTLHVNETWSQLDAAYASAVAGAIPDPLPCEIYCHSLTDPSILSRPLRARGAHTLTVFGLHTPHGLLGGRDPDGLRERLTEAAVRSLNSVLAEPIDEVLLRDSEGRVCIETKTTSDLERTLGMTAGNIFHGGLTWPFAEDDEPLDTPARCWGVATNYDRILLCGSGARRGGAVSGIGGHNAAMAVLES
jgi:phytoene dehydrogenase-like protein